ncbi:hypothetical protein B0A55_02128 [Friedmanniomyces simplex]|uniref:Myb-like DNA-binding domain-containing protein n=1 Tax=Friedmanniomyces simplex TaxID=329884 RepID=A0A4U0XLA7_9PEZI|nr:hypothetical protein B0A55_02128 [Friedmanniomyces simplex]
MSCTNEQFLFCTIEHSTNGVVNWQKVGEIFGIKDTAARMRYTRMKKKFGTFGTGSPSAAGDEEAADKSDQAETPKKTPLRKAKANKKRKVEESGLGDGAEEEGEGRVKGEPEEEVFT